MSYANWTTVKERQILTALRSNLKNYLADDSMSDDSNESLFFDAEEFDDDDGDDDNDNIDVDIDMNNMMLATGMDINFSDDDEDHDDATFSTDDSSSESSMSTIGLMEQEINDYEKNLR
jgi:hypothetical protein